MAVVRPFRGYRYHPRHNAIENLVSVPYDQIRPAQRAAYAARDPYNIVHIILPDPEHGEARYEQAARRYRDAIAAGALVQDPDPSYYIYEQSFADWTGAQRTRTGLIGLGRVEEFSSRIILPHEQTFPKHKQDRLNLVRHCGAYFGSIFMLYEDPAFEMHKRLSACRETCGPVADFGDEAGIRHRLWRLSGEETRDLSRFFEPRTLFIADGHHRYETALNFRNEMREAGRGRPAYDYRLMTFVNLYDPGLVILPTHRLVHGLSGVDWAGAERALGQRFDLTPLALRGGPEACGRQLLEALARGPAGQVRIGLCLPGNRGWILGSRGGETFGEDLDAFDRDTGLDVQVLHEIVLRRVLNLSLGGRADEGQVEYLRRVEDLLGGVQTDPAAAGFALNATRLDQVRRVILNGRLMPHKSTDFYPKLDSGLVIQDLGEDPD